MSDNQQRFKLDQLQEAYSNYDEQHKQSLIKRQIDLKNDYTRQITSNAQQRWQERQAEITEEQQRIK